MFFENFDSVWPDNANKLAYTFLASTSDDTFGDTTMLVVDGRLVMDPLRPPTESTRIWLNDWLKTTPFDLTIDYYRILKDLEEESYLVSREDIVKMEKTFRHAPTNPNPKFLSRHWEKQKRSCLVRECETNYECLAGGSPCLCNQCADRPGRWCMSTGISAANGTACERRLLSAKAL
ncbi:hypothetical protein HF325_003783 [Metschnikowia pulcherrima]|uniref:Uncharacterized protein n=1 Tax=Metschnikowia pulcherrima TaxID=27326 RepID=A0A8H7GRL6_9ASCO|nr:hypothetical protein HF325_003783 [Metschnikowia pulcherrima]